MMTVSMPLSTEAYPIKYTSLTSDNLTIMRPHYIKSEVWETMNHKEQDYILMLTARKFTKSEIMRRLYIETDAGYWKLQKRVKAKISAGNCKE